MKHIVVAVEAPKESRGAIVTAMRWGARAGAPVTILTIRTPSAVAPAAPAGVGAGGQHPATDGATEHWMSYNVEPEQSWTRPGLATAVGVPSVEIARFAEDTEADLLVLGREARSAVRHAEAGDSADAVARRSRVPCLFVPAPLGIPRKLLVALSANKQGHRVYVAARRVATAIGAELDVITVEPKPDHASAALAPYVPSAATVKLQQLLSADGAKLRIRRGAVVPEMLAEVEATRAQVLVIGYHRGGLPTEVRVSSIGRALAGLAPCAVLTVPL